jgi:hypothetical protein
MRLRPRLALALLLPAAPAVAEVRWGAGAGTQSDAPLVSDGRRFESKGGLAPVAGVFLAWSSDAGWGGQLAADLARREFASPAFPTDTPVVADFLELGVHGRWRAWNGGGWEAWVAAGPQVGFRLRARRRFRELDQDVTEELREADFKIALRLLAARRWGGGQLFLEGRLAFGITDLDATNQQEIRPRILGICIGYGR